MSYEFDNDRPIYIQIVSLIKQDIIAGKYPYGEKLPSVRELSAHYRVNPNTMQRAFAELESVGLVYTERTNGRFVSEDKEMIANIRDEAAMDSVKEFLQQMKDLGIDSEEIMTLIQKVRKGDAL